MRDQPGYASSPPPADDNAHPPETTPEAARHDADDDPVGAAMRDEAAARSTVVALPTSDGAGLAWLKRGAGLGGIALLAAIGWVLFDPDKPRTKRVAEVDRPMLPDHAPPRADAAPPSGATPPPPRAEAAPPPRAEAAKPSSATSPPPADAPAPQAAAPPPRADAAPPSGATRPPRAGAAPPSGATPPRVDAPSTPADASTPRPADTARDEDLEADTPEPMDRYEATVRIEKGDTLESLLRDMDFAPDEIANAMRALKPVMKGARLPVGEIITLRILTPPAADAKPILQALIIRPDARREITVERGGDGGYSAKLRTFDVVLRLVRGGGVVKGSLRASAEAAGIPSPVLAEMLRAYSWDVNFQYDVKGGDRFAVLLEQAVTTDGRLVGAGRILWAQLTTGAGRHVFNVYRFKPEQGADFFYYSNGQSVVKSFLRTPMDLSRVSSHYGLRNHPILGFTSMHAGVDFAAPYGTPILAAGAGTIAQAAPNGGYGNWVKIDHGGGVETAYAHMERFAPGIRPGARVRQGQVVGFVGSTGLSTGPHLHFELHHKGTPVNPLNARATQRASLGGRDMERFRSIVVRTDRIRDTVAPIVTRVSEARGSD